MIDRHRSGSYQPGNAGWYFVGGMTVGNKRQENIGQLAGPI
jgi:hypothetical protein